MCFKINEVIAKLNFRCGIGISIGYKLGDWYSVLFTWSLKTEECQNTIQEISSESLLCVKDCAGYCVG